MAEMKHPQKVLRMALITDDEPAEVLKPSKQLSIFQRMRTAAGDGHLAAYAFDFLRCGAMSWIP